MNSVKWENDATLVGLLEKACIQERVHVAMHRLDVAPRQARQIADSQGTGAGHGAAQRPSFRRRHFHSSSRLARRQAPWARPSGGR